MSELRPKENAANGAGAVAVESALRGVLSGVGAEVKGEAAVKFLGATKGEVRLVTAERVDVPDLKGTVEAALEGAGVSVVRARQKGAKVEVTFAVGAQDGAGQKQKQPAKKQKGKGGKAAPARSTVSAVDAAYERVMERAAAATGASRESLEGAMGSDVMDALHALHNRGYSNGMSSRENAPGLYIPLANN